MFRKCLFIFSAIMLLGPLAQAGIHLEPYASYTSGNLTGPASDLGADVDGSTSGFGLGARVGWGMLGFAFGVDYGLGLSGSFKDGSTKGSFTDSRLSAFALYEFPILVRVIGGYTIAETSTFDNDASGVPTVDFKGNGIYIGAGYTGLPLVAINLELHTKTYSKADSTSLDDTKITYYVLSASFPLSI